MKRRLTICVLALLLSTSGFAQRQESIIPDLDEASRKGDMARFAQQKANARFDEADENKDGVLSREEVCKHLPYLCDHFDAYDKDHDGRLSWHEVIGHDRWERIPATAK